MGNPALGSYELEYVADMLRAVSHVRYDLGLINQNTIEELATHLSECEASLRRVVAELADAPNAA